MADNGDMTLSNTLSLDSSVLEAALVAEGVSLNGFQVRGEVGSTNTELVRHVTTLQANSFFFESDEPGPWAAPSLMASVNQTGGRGRTGRSWETAPGTSLTFSLHVELSSPADTLSWLPLVVGNAVATVIRDVTGVSAQVKWPNDIVVNSAEQLLEGWLGLRKLGGILVERVGSSSVVIGIGINVSQDASQLPVPSATSLKLEMNCRGMSDPSPALPYSAERLLAQLVASVLERIQIWQACDGDVEKSGDRSLAEALSTTVGAQVKVALADGAELDGLVTELGIDGSLKIVDASGETHSVYVGDVSHLRLR